MAVSQESNTGGVQTLSPALSQPPSPFCAGFCGCKGAGSQRLSFWGSLKPGFAFVTERNPLSPSPPHIRLKIQNFSFPNVSLGPTLQTPFKIQLISEETIDPKMLSVPKVQSPSVLPPSPPPPSIITGYCGVIFCTQLEKSLLFLFFIFYFYPSRNRIYSGLNKAVSVCVEDWGVLLSRPPLSVRGESRAGGAQRQLQVGSLRVLQEREPSVHPQQDKLVLEMVSCRLKDTFFFVFEWVFTRGK